MSKIDHYHVCENTPGYLPDSDPHIFDSKEEAREFALDSACEMQEQKYRITVESPDRYICRGKEGQATRVIEVTGCEGCEEPR